MPVLAEAKDYNGVVAKIDRLGLSALFEELKAILTGFDLRVEERTDANGGRRLREMLDERFSTRGGWAKSKPATLTGKNALS